MALLQAVSEEYESMPSFEFEGLQATSLPDSNCTIEFQFQVIGGQGAVGSPDGIPNLPPTTIRFTGSKLTRECTKAIEKLGVMTSPGWWIAFSALQIGVTAVRELPPETLHFPDRNVRCAVLEARYDAYTQAINGFAGAVRYWVEGETRLVRRVEFDEVIEQGLRRWVVRVDKLKKNTKSPWPFPTGTDSYARPPLVGKPAPDFKLTTSTGETVHLAELRGHAVLLAFWATWCTACEVETPLLEKFQREVHDSSVILGITDEDSSVLGEWMRKYNRAFRSVTDGKAVFEAYGISALPVLVVIDSSGTVRGYLQGMLSERALRQTIEKTASVRETTAR